MGAIDRTEAAGEFLFCASPAVFSDRVSRPLRLRFPTAVRWWSRAGRMSPPGHFFPLSTALYQHITWTGFWGAGQHLL